MVLPTSSKKRKAKGGLKMIHVVYLCIPLGLVLIAGAVFLLNHGAAFDASSTRDFALRQFSNWLHLTGEELQSASTVTSTKPAASLPSGASSTTTTATSAGAASSATSAATATSAAGNATVENPKQNSKYAYVTLISGIDKSFKYRGFLYNALIMKKSLADAGSLADFIALIGFSDADTAPFEQDMNLLRQKGIITYMLPRLVHDSHKLSFAEMALLKITPWSFTQYRKVQFFDGDVMPTRNMDCFFLLPSNTFTIGAVSPLNSGWYLAIPDTNAYDYMLAKAKWRLERDWDKTTGWAEADPKLPAGLTVRGGSPCAAQWDFNGADMDQGLLTHYYVLNNGNVMLIDTAARTATKYASGLLHQPGVPVPIKQGLDCCNGGVPTTFFAHFTGRQKPWMVENIGSLEAVKKNADLILWANLLDSLQLPVNSQTVAKLGLGSPLGFWNHNFPKGGLKGKKLRGGAKR